MWIVDSLAALIMGALSGMGIGGGGLMVIYMTLLKGVGQIEAQGINLYFFWFASAASLFVHSVKRKINYPLVLLLGLVGMPSAYGGSRLAAAADPERVRVIFGMMLVVSGVIALARSEILRGIIKKK